MASYRIWFDVNGRLVELPVNPQEVSITYPGNPTNYDVEGLGEIIIPRIPKLATLSFESFFPRDRVYQTMVNSDAWYTPEWYVTFFRNVQKSRQPFELTIVRGSDPIIEYDGAGNATQESTAYFDTVLKAVLIDITTTDKGGEPGDVYYNMTLNEYRDATPQTLAELSSESYDFSGDVLEQEMVLVANRPQQTGAIVVNTPVQVNGKVYQQPDEPEVDWRTVKAKANQLDRVVSRVLPPEAAGAYHSVYIDSLGWVDKGSCRMEQKKGSVNGLNRLVTDNYD